MQGTANGDNVRDISGAGVVTGNDSVCDNVISLPNISLSNSDKGNDVLPPNLGSLVDDSMQKCLNSDCLSVMKKQLERYDSEGKIGTDFNSVAFIQSEIGEIVERVVDLNSKSKEVVNETCTNETSAEVCSPRKKRWKRLAREKSVCRNLCASSNELGKRTPDFSVEIEMEKA
ncbi:hypothetical protein ACOSP7_015295 [Xanthoceras sorbifolium]